ncbi:MAG: LTA synthase family protein, partial [Polyangiaceae bacterium]
VLMQTASQKHCPGGCYHAAKSDRFARLGWDFAIFAIVLLGCKAHRLVTTNRVLGTHGWDLAIAWLYGVAADLFFLSAYALAWYVVLAKMRAARLLAIPFRVFTLALSVVVLADHAFLLSTGATLDWHILRYGAAHFRELLPILLAFGWRRLTAAMAAVLAVALLPSALRSLRLSERYASLQRTSHALDLSRRLWRRVALVLFAIVAQSCLIHSNGASAPPGLFVQNVHVRLGKTALADWWRRDRRATRAEKVVQEELIETNRDAHYNIVLVVLESARARSFSPYDSGMTATPFFQELSERGALVENAYTVAPHTTKALVSIQCGIYPRLDPEPYEAVEKGIPVRCLPDLLRDVGYRSAFFQPAEEHFERRKDLVREFGYEHFAGKQSLGGRGFDESNYLGFEDRTLLDPVTEWVDRQGGPFVLSVLTLASHHPYAIPAGFASQPFAGDRAENDYVNTLAYTDQFLRELFDRFATRGLLGKTIFVVLGDHGEAFGEHGVRQHDAVPYEEGVHVPMVLLGPPFKAGQRITGLRQHIDVLPTLLESVGFRLEQPSRPGRSMLSTRGHERLYFSCHYRDYCLAGRNARDKVIHHYAQRGPELFDLVVDPDERTNLAARRHLQVSEWTDDLRRWKAQVSAQFAEGREWHLARDVSSAPPFVARPLEVEFAPYLRLLGYDVEREALPIGEQITIAHHFYVEQTPDPSLSLVAHLMGPRTEDLTHAPVRGNYPLSQWKSGDYVTDRFTYFARPGTPQGEYRLRIGLWRNRQSPADSVRPRSLSEGPFLDQQSRVETAVFAVEAAPFEREEYVDSTPPPGWENSETKLSSEVGLMGCKVSKDRVKRGVRTTLSCLYHARRDHPGGRLCVILDGPIIRSIVHTPVKGTYPLEEWKANQYIRDELDLFMTTADKEGDYRIRVALADESPSPSGQPCPARPESSVEVGTLTLAE